MPPTFFDGFDRTPDKAAFVVDGDTLTYRALERRAAAYAAHLGERGVRPGDRVAVYMPSGTATLVAIVAHLRCGVVHVPINTRYREGEISHILRDSAATALVSGAGSIASQTARALRSTGEGPDELIGPDAPGLVDDQPDAEPSAVPDPKDAAPAMLIYTSGTTGRSKGVILTHGGLRANIAATTGLWRWSPDDVIALALPLFHVHGLGLGVLGTMLRGMTAHVTDRFAAAWVVDRFRHDGATVFMGVPTMYHALLSHLDAAPTDAAQLARARLFTSGSAALPARHLERFEAHTGHRILERYGMSETGFTLSNPYADERRAGTVGRAVPGYDVRVIAEDGAPCEPGAVGEIHVRGDGMMAGYWRLPEATAASFTADGWFRTGDVATVDAEGYHRIVGRQSVDVIKSGGFKISAREIEDVLAEDPTLAEVAVVGLPDERWGQRIAAAVVLAEGVGGDADAQLLERLGDRVEARLASYKRPRQLRVLTGLPRNALGKVQKHHIIALFDL